MCMYIHIYTYIHIYIFKYNVYMSSVFVILHRIARVCFQICMYAANIYVWFMFHMWSQIT